MLDGAGVVDGVVLLLAVLLLLDGAGVMDVAGMVVLLAVLLLLDGAVMRVILDLKRRRMCSPKSIVVYSLPSPPRSFYWCVLGVHGLNFLPPSLFLLFFLVQ